MRRAAVGAAIVCAAAAIAALTMYLGSDELGDARIDDRSRALPSDRSSPDLAPDRGGVLGANRRAIESAAGSDAADASEDEWTGFVVDRERTGIAGARVELLRGDARIFQHAESAGRETTADEHGRFRLDTTGGTILLASKPGYATACADLGGGTPAMIALVPAATLSGRVLADPGGAPIAGARVAVRTYVVPEWATAAVSDAAGGFRIEGIEADGAKEVVIQAPDAFPVSDAVAFDAPREITCEFRIPQEPVLRGRVIDLESGAPVGDAELIPLVVGGGEYVAATRSRVDGTFEICGVTDPYHVYGIGVRKRGYAGSSRNLLASPPSEADGECVMGVLAQCAVEGTVRGVDGMPIADAFIFTGLGREQVAQADFPFELPAGLELGYPPSSSSRTATDGTYRLEGLVPIVTYPFILLDAGYMTVNREMPKLARPGETARLDWTLVDATAVVFGDITLNGSPANARIRWYSSTHGTAGSEAGEVKAGRYRLERVTAGSIDVAYDLGVGFDTMLESIEVPAGAEVRHDIRITLDLSQIRGVVYGLESKESVRVIANRAKPKARVDCETAADGSFVLRLPDEVWAEWELDLDEAQFPNNSVMEAYAGATSVSLTPGLR